MNKFSRLFSVLFMVLVAGQASADFKWSGTYRFEGLSVSNSDVADGGPTKAYMLHHLVLRPEIVAYDGLVIRSRFDIMNNSDPALRHHQIGQVVGSGVGTANPTTSTNQDNSNTLSQQQAADTMAINELYAVWSHEFGALTVGRAPVHFGLGMTYNSGSGPFDHFLENRDLVAYKIVMGNFYLMPVIGKVFEGKLNTADDVNDYMVQAQYENPETELAMGVIYHSRRSSSAADSNDTPIGVIGNGGGQSSNFAVDYYNFFVSQWVDAIKIAFELGFAEGGTGIVDTNGLAVEQKGFGAAIKMNYLPKSSNWEASLDLGYASGDDPSTTNKFEGYMFDRNYDVAFLLFNHPLGQYDILRTAYLNGKSAGGPPAGPGRTTAASTLYDVEAVSNALFASVGVNYKWAEKYSFGTQLTYGQLNKDPLNSNVDSGLGFEVDLQLKYAPFEGFQWINRVGILSPGSAFEGGSNNFTTGTAYGMETKAAIFF